MYSNKVVHYWTAALAALAVIIAVLLSAPEAFALSDPVTDENGIATWDCVYFGHYPQSSDGKGGFRNEPIKWRVLSIKGNDAFILADRNIDAMPYCAAENDPKYDCLWHVSTVRSWLNGYGGGENQKNIDYSSDNFIDKAFTAAEQKAIKTTQVITDKYTDWHYNWTDQHHYYMQTNDKVYLLEYDEAINPAYGFTSDDEETITRVALNTAFTAAGGSKGDPYRSKEGVRDSWILRSPGEYSMYADMITEDGEYKEDISDVNPVNVSQGIRPVLHLDLSKTSVWSEAGVHKALFPQDLNVTVQYEKKYGDEPFDLGASCTGDSVIEYRSDDEDVASVDSTGRVTINAAGTAVITVTAPATDLYEEVVRTTTVNVAGESQEVTVPVDAVHMTYGDKPVSLGATAVTEIVYSSDNTKVAAVDADGNVTAKGPGTCVITVKARAHEQYKPAFAYVNVTVEKASAKITAVKKKFIVKAKKLKKKAQSVTFKAKVNSGGKITFTGKAANSKSRKALKLNGKTGKITVKKGTRKGTYKMTVTVKAKATAKYKAASKKVKVTVVVK